MSEKLEQLDVYVAKLRRSFVSEWSNQTEKSEIVDYMGADEAAELVYQMILAHLGW